jgi:signal transduction histidine kinase/CheY-like chemotaxis protein
VRWDAFARVLRRLSGDLGGLEPLTHLMEESQFGTASDLYRAIASHTMSVRSLYTLGARWLGPSLFSNTSATSENLSGGRILQEVRINDGYEDCIEFFHIQVGMLRTTPRILGLPDAQVVMTLGERRATYLISLPRGKQFWTRIRRVFKRHDSLTGAILELNQQRAEIEERYRGLERANAQVAAQSRNLELLNDLGHEVARHMHISELAAAVVALLGEHFPLTGAVLWASALEAGRLDEVGRLGETDGGVPTRSYMLRAGSRPVGRLDVWRTDGEADEDLLEKFVPWVALAVDNALAFRALSDRTRLLQEEMAERRRVERHLVQAQKLEAVGALAGGLAHDFNNILTAIRVYTELVAQRLPDDHPARGDLEEISVAGDRVAALTTQLLAFSRRPLVHPEILDLNSVLRRMEPMLKRLMREGCGFELCTSSAPLRVEIDPGQLEQVIVNLVHNARDALAAAGTVSVVSGLCADGSAELRVEDNGAGMDPAILSRVFEPFFTTKPPGQGTGLGLTAAYRIVNELGGRIEMDSAIGKGTRVSVLLPVCAERGAAAETDAPLRLTGKETVLVVEGDEQLMRLSRRTLEDHGYTVLESRTGEDALRMCSEYSGALHVLLVDLGVSDIAGPDLVERIRSSRRELAAVLYLSGNAAHASTSGPLRTGERLVRKPFAPDSLLAAMRSALSETATR